jgi:Spy/CpxP family protein refolding chaperone
MNSQFLRSRAAFWGMIFMIVLNGAVLITFFIKSQPADAIPPKDCGKGNSANTALIDELGLTSEQKTRVLAINEQYRRTAEPVAAAIRDNREKILSELEADHPDTILIRNCIDTIALLQAEIQLKNIQQYLDLKKVCTPEQALRLSALYRNLYGCPMKGNQMQNRYKHRHGQGKADTGCCN